MPKEKSDYIIQSVDHAFKVLEQFNETTYELRITELSNRLNLHKNKVFRLLATLTYRNYIEQVKDNDSYHLGLKVLDLGQSFMKQIGFLGIVKSVQECLVRKCNETAYLSIMKGSNVIYLNAVESDMPVRVVPRLGVRHPFYCTEAGKVIAASLRDELLRVYLRDERLKKHTSNTISDPVELRLHLQEVLETGYAIDDEEFEIGVKGVGVPFRDYTKKIVGALSISGPSNRMTTSRMKDELVPLLKEAASEVSSRLGYF